MSNPDRNSDIFSGNLRTNIRMSKIARKLQSGASTTHWIDMVKMLFRTDPHGGRKHEMLRLFPLTSISEDKTAPSSSYSIEQWQYLLFLMLIISVAERRTQDMYASDFAERCDSISERHGLKEDQYWYEGGAPSEWNELNEEFEKRSLEILFETLNEYHQQEIAALIRTNGLDEFFLIIRNIRAQFLRMLKISSSGGTSQLTAESGSIPETLYPSKG